MLFDKSFIQSLTVDESVWFDMFFLTNVCPIFYVETLADLRKTGIKGRNATDEVKIIADKFPQMKSAPSAHHVDLCLTNLLGYEIAMTGQIPLEQGRLVKVGDDVGVVSEKSSVADAFLRWQEERFLEVELGFAKVWRDALSNLKFKGAKTLLEKLGIDVTVCKTLDDARGLGANLAATPLLSDEQMAIIESLIGVPIENDSLIIKRYIEAGRPSIQDFAPYAAFVLEVEIFFIASLASGLISTKMPSNRVDSAYLFYLPFCMVFVSSDKYHKRTAPYFLRANQDFIWGSDLKDALCWLNSHFSTYPDDMKAKGVMALAQSIPTGAPELLIKLWDKHLPKLHSLSTDEPSSRDRSFEAIVDKCKQMEMAPSIHPDRQTFRVANIASAAIKRSVKSRRGSWLIFPRNIRKE